MHVHHDRSRPAAPPSESTLTCDDSQVSLTGPELCGLASENRTVTVACASGTRYTATWIGVPVLDLFADAGLDNETTHLLVENADSYRVYINVYATLDAVIAYARDGTPIDEGHDYEMRLIAPDVGGSQTMEGIRAVEALALDSATGPESLEGIFKRP